jgi:release factor glutamine methyltransferase
VTNPPYIADAELSSLQPEVRDYEPRTALAGGVDGLEIVRQIISRAPDHLTPGSSILIEIGHGQAESVEREFDAHIWQHPLFEKDLQGIPRVVIASLRGQSVSPGQ